LYSMKVTLEKPSGENPSLCGTGGYADRVKGLLFTLKRGLTSMSRARIVVFSKLFWPEGRS